MKGFEKLLDTVRKSNPNLISEQEAQAMLDDYNAYETQLQSDSFENGKAAGFEEGYREGMEKQKAVCKQELDELLAKCDEEATNKVEAIVKMLNDDHAEKLQEVYDCCMQNMVPYGEVQAMDEDHADKFAQAMDALDADHADKMACACESVKREMAKAATKKLNEINAQFDNVVKEANETISTLKKSLKSERAKKIDLLTESVEKYLNYALQNSIPSRKLVSEAKYNASQKAIEKITSILKINSILQESKDGIFKEYEDKLLAAKSAQDKLLTENVELKSKLEKEEAKLLLESKIAKCTPAEAQFLRTYFNNAKNSRVIEEQIEDARTAFKRIHAEKRNSIVDKAKSSTTTASSVIKESKRDSATTKTEPSKKAVVENNNTASTGLGINPFINAYSQMLKNQ
jgi:hypothetical protein